MLHRQFGQDGRIDFRGYCGLYTYVAEWKEVFARFDADRSGSIQTPELGNALQSFGFTLNPNLVQLLARKYCKHPRPANPTPSALGHWLSQRLRCFLTRQRARLRRASTAARPRPASASTASSAALSPSATCRTRSGALTRTTTAGPRSAMTSSSPSCFPRLEGLTFWLKRRFPRCVSGLRTLGGA